VAFFVLDHMLFQVLECNMTTKGVLLRGLQRDMSLLQGLLRDYIK